MVITRRRLTAVALAVTTTAALGTSLTVPSVAAAAKAPVQVGLFGSQDPTYDGAFRQSLGLLAFAAVGRTPPAESVTWLLGQQCTDGGFQAYRPDVSVACTKSDPATYSGEDTNSTGIASVALRAIGSTAAADKALAWVLASQRADGGFPYFVGGDSDANSTAVVLFASNADGRKPTDVTKGGVSAAAFLQSLQVGCTGVATDGDGGFAFQDYGTGLTDNDAASVQATLALTGASLPLAAQKVGTTVPRATCAPAAAAVAATTAELGAGHIARVLDAFGGAIPQFDFASGTRKKGTVSTGDTAWAALSLAAAGVGSAQLDAALATLATQTGVPLVKAVTGHAASAATDQPGLLGVVALAGLAGGASSTSIDSAVTRIGATMRTAPASATPSPTPTTSTSDPATASPTTTSTSTTGNGGLAPTGTSPMTAVLGGLGGGLVVLGLLALVTTRRRGVHA